MKHELTYGALKSAATCAFGIIGMSLPNWIVKLDNILGGLDGFYKFGIFILTAALIYFQIKKAKKNESKDTKQ